MLRFRNFRLPSSEPGTGELVHLFPWWLTWMIFWEIDSLRCSVAERSCFFDRRVNRRSRIGVTDNEVPLMDRAIYASNYYHAKMKIGYSSTPCGLTQSYCNPYGSLTVVEIGDEQGSLVLVRLALTDILGRPQTVPGCVSKHGIPCAVGPEKIFPASIIPLINTRTLHRRIHQRRTASVPIGFGTTCYFTSIVLKISLVSNFMVFWHLQSILHGTCENMNRLNAVLMHGRGAESRKVFQLRKILFEKILRWQFQKLCLMPFMLWAHRASHRFPKATHAMANQEVFRWTNHCSQFVSR